MKQNSHETPPNFSKLTGATKYEFGYTNSGGFLISLLKQQTKQPKNVITSQGDASGSMSNLM